MVKPPVTDACTCWLCDLVRHNGVAWRGVAKRAGEAKPSKAFFLYHIVLSAATESKKNTCEAELCSLSIDTKRHSLPKAQAVVMVVRV